ncbi:MAG: helix-turn-helix domain-containing protein [Blautia sp.]|nr:helix-turn-helix domain-containing protein [Blautia sp.]
MGIGDKIKKQRLKSGLSQKSLGEKLGVSQQNIAQYENGKRIPKLGNLQKIATVLNVNINDLLESPLDDSILYHHFKDDNISDNPISRRYINSELTIQVDDWQQIDIELVKIFKKLNDAGKAIAIERVEELTEIPRYTQNRKNVSD